MANTHNEDAFVAFERVQKSYDGETLVVKDLNLTLPKGEFLTMLGPSGSGKTTCLMMLAGFETATHGEIKIDGVSINNIPPHKRGIGMVFQNYALFPHMTIAENLAFPLEVRKIGKSDREAKVKRALDMVEMGSFGGRRPAQLSGGQQQRVALARALVFEPELVLMDEPLGALDKQLREKMQFEITHLAHNLGITTVYVTHDQREALTMSDRIAVVNHGRIEQVETPERLYRQPRSFFVADFIGESISLPVELSNNTALLNGRVLKSDLPIAQGSGGHRLIIRPELLEVVSNAVPDNANDLSGNIQDIIYQGDSVLVIVQHDNLGMINVRVPANRAGQAGLPSKGEQIGLALYPEDTIIVPEQVL